MSPEPDRDKWVTRLRSDSDDRDAAIEELRGIILRGLSRSLNHRYGGCLQAEDVVQDALLKILDSLDRFEGRSRFTTWAMTVATRVGISELRRKHCQDVSLDSLKPEDSMKIEVEDDEEASPAQRMDRKFLTQKLKDLISSELSGKQKIAVRALLEGMPVEEIASRTGSNRNAVYKLVHDARLKLREGFEQAGIVADDVTTIFA